jgi:phospholipid/cholesterol/gamma-HCH transport system substrate-binding protein
MGLNVDTAIANVDQSLIEVTRAAESISNSWLFRLFSKKRKTQDDQSIGQLEVNEGDTIIIRREKTTTE